MKVLETFRIPTRETAYMDLISGRVQSASKGAILFLLVIRDTG